MRPNHCKRAAMLRAGLLVGLCLIVASVQPFGAFASASRPLESQAPSATVYYVSPNGNDSNPGTLAQPWRTIQKAANTLVAGNTVYIRGGTYRERVTPQRSGNVGQEIVYAAYPGETVTLDGSGITLPDEMVGLFDISSRHDIRVSGLRVVNVGPNVDNAGILVGFSSNITIERNYTYNTTSSGIGIWKSTNIVIDRNEVVLANTTGGEENLTVAGTNGFVVSNNHVHDGGNSTRGGQGIDVKDGACNGKIYGNQVDHVRSIGIYLDAWDKHTYNIEVYRNRVHDIRDDYGIVVGSEAGGLLENIKIYNNLVYNNPYVGISVSYNGFAATRPLSNILIANNTVYGNGTSGWGGGIEVGNPDATGVVIRNNIFSRNPSWQIRIDSRVPAANVTIDHNLIDAYRGYSGEVRGSAYVEQDPRLISPSTADFHLQGGSPAIDRGASTAAPVSDYDSNVRPQDGNRDGVAAYDIGSYEVWTFIPTTRVYLPLARK